ncbi:MAG: recombinase family protein [Candidatus Omnitrophota bacterium]|nr:MAG: recombinase family protein [Candidatus Omnitrophota bacterium]
MKVALYARVSSDQQAEKNNSIPSQLRLLHEYADKHNMSIYKEYIDEGESALSVNRPAFLEMISETKKKFPPFQAILVWKLSRFARNRQDSILYKSLLKKRGIEVISISEPIDNTPQGQLMEGMIEVIDEFYSAVLAQETLRGMAENARKGYRNGGFSVYGYKNIRIYDEKKNAKTKYEINPSEAKAVRLVFELYAKGNGLKNIAIHLNKYGYKARSGNLWNKNTIANILRNEVYIGWTVFNKRDKKTFGKQFKPKDEWVVIKNTHEPIVNEELFYKVQRLIEQRQPKNQPAQVTASQYLLSGLIKCGKCKGAYGVTGYGRDRKYAYYNCITYSKKGKDICPGHRLRADELDIEVTERVKNLLFSEENMKKLVNDINAATKSLRIGYGKKIIELKRKASDLQLRLMRQYEAIESAMIDLSLVAPRLKELKTQKDALQEEISYYESLNSQNQPVYITKPMIDKYRKEMEQIFMGDNVQEQREFLKKFIEKIIVKDEGIKIVYYAPGAKFPSSALPDA